MQQAVDLPTRQLNLKLAWPDTFAALGRVLDTELTPTPLPSPSDIRQAKLKGYSGVEDLLALVQAPFDEHPARDDNASFPPNWASHIEISCSS